MLVRGGDLRVGQKVYFCGKGWDDEVHLFERTIVSVGKKRVEMNDWVSGLLRHKRLETSHEFATDKRTAIRAFIEYQEGLIRALDGQLKTARKNLTLAVKALEEPAILGRVQTG